jgi:prophage regulatory protein
MPSESADTYVRLPDVKSRTGLSRTTIYRMVRAGDFPAPKRLGVRAVGWLSSDLARWREGRPDARDPRLALPAPKSPPPKNGELRVEGGTRVVRTNGGAA